MFYSVKERAYLLLKEHKRTKNILTFQVKFRKEIATEITIITI